MNAVLDTLFLPLNQGVISRDDLGENIAFFNARYAPVLSGFQKNFLFLQQYFKPYAAGLAAQGFDSKALDYPPAHTQDAVFVLLPKNITEARGLILTALISLKEGGLLFCAADNKAGGSRLGKLFAEVGLAEGGRISKNKARVIWGRKAKTYDTLPGENAPVQINGFWSWPGIFGWDKIDRGSEILAQYLPCDFKGNGADFGCGYGYLARHVLKGNAAIRQFYCIDADARALSCCSQNLAAFSNVSMMWEDLTQTPKALRDLDFIVMNPPFHEGQKTDIATGIAFIKTAHAALKKGGVLWMVANAHLPYEESLRALFSLCETPHEGQGFKIFRCIK